MTDDDDPLVTLTLRGPDGQAVRIDATLDTGFTEYLMLPRDILHRLGVAQIAEETALLADGRAVRLPVYEVAVDWDGEKRDLPAYAADGKPLLGAKLLHGSLVTLEYISGGSVTIEPAGIAAFVYRA